MNEATQYKTKNQLLAQQSATFRETYVHQAPPWLKMTEMYTKTTTKTAATTKLTDTPKKSTHSHNALSPITNRIIKTKLLPYHHHLQCNIFQQFPTVCLMQNERFHWQKKWKISKNGMMMFRVQEAKIRLQQ